MSHAPIGVNPFGECPQNPKDGKLLGGNADHEVVVERRIRALESRASKAESALEKVSPAKKEMAERIEELERELDGAMRVLGLIRKNLGGA